MFARNAFGSQKMSCISESHSTFWYWDDAKGGTLKLQQCQTLICHRESGRRGLWLVVAIQVWLSDTPHSAYRWLTALRVRVQHGNDRVRGQRAGSYGAGTHIGTQKDQQQYRSFFKATEGLHILTFFLFLFFFVEVLVLSLRKSPSEVSRHIEATFCLFSISFFFP